MFHFMQMFLISVMSNFKEKPLLFFSPILFFDLA